MRFLILLLCIVSALQLSCVNTRQIVYETQRREAKPPDYPIEILESPSVSRPYKVIGVVEANAGKLHSSEDTLNKLRAAARQMGADALLDVNRGSRGPREIWSAKAIAWQRSQGG
jgi:hypothetical protein